MITALARSPYPVHQACTYLRWTIINTYSLTAIASASFFGASYLGAPFAIAAVALIVIACVALSRAAWLRREIDRHLAWSAMHDRVDRQFKLLESADPLRLEQYRELRCLLAGIETTDPTAVVRFELVDLLDDFVRAAMLETRYRAVLALAGSLPVDSHHTSPRVREIVDRRVRDRDVCKQCLDRIADQLEAVRQLVHLIAARVSWPPVDDGLDRELERRVGELDDDDAALEQLSA